VKRNLGVVGELRSGFRRWEWHAGSDRCGGLGGVERGERAQARDDEGQAPLARDIWAKMTGKSIHEAWGREKVGKLLRQEIAQVARSGAHFRNQLGSAIHEDDDVLQIMMVKSPPPRLANDSSLVAQK
jgi:hypothetical protein